MELPINGSIGFTIKLQSVHVRNSFIFIDKWVKDHHSPAILSLNSLCQSLWDEKFAIKSNTLQSLPGFHSVQLLGIFLGKENSVQLEKVLAK